jgi:hypothetical protein
MKYSRRSSRGSWLIMDTSCWMILYLSRCLWSIHEFAMIRGVLCSIICCLTSTYWIWVLTSLYETSSSRSPWYHHLTALWCGKDILKYVQSLSLNLLLLMMPDTIHHEVMSSWRCISAPYWPFIIIRRLFLNLGVALSHLLSASLSLIHWITFLSETRHWWTSGSHHYRTISVIG